MVDGNVIEPVKGVPAWGPKHDIAAARHALKVLNDQIDRASSLVYVLRGYVAGGPTPADPNVLAVLDVLAEDLEYGGEFGAVETTLAVLEAATAQ